MKKLLSYLHLIIVVISFNLTSFQGYAEVIFYVPFNGSSEPLIGEVKFQPQRPVRDVILWKIPIGYGKGMIGEALDTNRSGIVYSTEGNFNAAKGTISFWVNPQWDGTDKTHYCAFFEVKNWGLLYKYTDQTSLNFALKDKDGTFYYGCGADISDWKLGQWHHIAITWDCGLKVRERRLYIDGELKSVGKINTTLLDSNSPEVSPFFTIGSRGGICPARSFIDEFYIFDEVLSNEYIEEAYHRTWHPLGEGVKARGRNRSFIYANRLKPSAKRPPFPERVNLRSGGSVELGKQWDITDAWRVWTETREKVSLNGYWRIRPARLSVWRKGYKVKDLPWLYLKVPGSWADEEFDIIDMEGNPIHGSNIGVWGNRSRYRIYEMWYERDLITPLSWRGRHVALEFNGVNSRGTVFLNGKQVGTVYEWEKASLDVTDTVKLGGRNRVDVLVAVPIDVDARRFRGIVGDVYLCAGPSSVEISNLHVRTSVSSKLLTIIGTCTNNDSKDKKVSISGKVSLKNRKVLDVPEFKTALKSKGGVEFQIQVPWKNPQLWSFENPVLYKLSLMVYDRSQSRRHRLLDQPYDIRFGFREFGIKADISHSRMEFYLNGNKTHLRAESSPPFNYNVYPSADENFIRNWFKTLKAAGFNSVRLYCAWDTARYVHYMDKLFDIADEMGIMLWPHAPDIIALQEVFDEPEVRKLYRDRVKNYLDRYANHPSIVMWHLNFNLGAYVGDIHPAALDGSYTPQFETMRKRHLIMAESEKIYRELDPTRPVFHHAAGNFGDIYSVMTYLGFDVPLQEREDWPLSWSVKGGLSQQEGMAKLRKPLVPIETGFPCILSWYENKTGSLSQVYSSAPLFVEYAAIYLGDDAYAMEKAENVKEYSESDPYLKREYLTKNSLHYMKIKSLFAKNTLRAWRTYGVSGIGLHAELWDAFWPLETRSDWKAAWETKSSYLTSPGPKPDHNPIESRIQDPTKPTPLGKTLRENFSPLLIYIAGSQGNVTSKDHSFFSFERVNKQIAAVNDSMSPVTFNVRWGVTLAGNDIVTDGKRITVVPGEISTLPISFITPKVEKRSEGRIWLTAITKDIPNREPFKDKFTFEIFPRHLIKEDNVQKEKQRKIKIALYDKVGKTAEMLTQAGVKFDRISGESGLSHFSAMPAKRGANIQSAGSTSMEKQPAYDAIIIGRESLDGVARKLLMYARGQGWLERGLTIICFEQRGNATYKTSNIFGLPIRETSDRYVFIRSQGHPILAGLSGIDFINWRKESDLIPPYSDFRVELRHHNAKSLAGLELKYPEGFWKWGNRGVVATYVIEKPHIGNFRILLDCGFDLMYTPLIEWIEGRGRIILCQLDVSNRYGVDPVVTRLVDNLLSYCSSRARVDWRDNYAQVKAAYFGDSETAQLLTQLKVDFSKTTLDGNLKDFAVLIIGDASENVLVMKKDIIAGFVSRGGRVFCVGRGTISSLSRRGNRATWLPFNLSAVKGDVFLGSVSNLNAPLFRGLSKSDFFWRRFYHLFTMRIADQDKFGNSGKGVIASTRYGKGYYIFCSINPQLFDDNWQKTKAARIIATILTNIGVKSSATLDFSRDKIDYNEFPFLAKTIGFNPYRYRRW